MVFNFVADERGKWWVVGSAWTGNIDTTKTSNEPKQIEGYSQKLLDLARKQRMNTDTRRSIFCILMSAEVSCFIIIKATDCIFFII